MALPDQRPKNSYWLSAEWRVRVPVAVKVKCLKTCGSHQCESVRRLESVLEASSNWKPVSKGSGKEQHFPKENGRFPSFSFYSVQVISFSSWPACQPPTNIPRALLIH